MLFVSMLSCSNVERESIDEISIKLQRKRGENVPFDYSQMIDSVKVISLSDVHTGYLEDVKYYAGKYFLHDKIQRSIVIVDNQGNKISEISRQGRSANEYVNLTAYDINPISGEINIYDESTGRIIVYSLYGEVIRVVHPDIPLFRDFSIDSRGNYYVYIPDYMEKGRRGLWRLDSEGRIQECVLPIPDSFHLCVIRNSPSLYFNRLSDLSLSLLSELNESCIYLVGKNGEVLPQYRFSFDVVISRELRKRDYLSARDMEDKTFYFFPFYVEADHWIVSVIWYQNETRTVYYDKVNKISHVVMSKSESIYKGKSPICILRSAGNKFLGINENEDGVQSIVVTFLK